MRILFITIISICSSIINKSIGQNFNKSDILLAYPQTTQIRDSYSANGVAWGFLPIPPHWDIENQAHINTYINNVSTIYNENRKIHVRIEFDASWELFIDYCNQNNLNYDDYACKTIDDNTFEYPWFSGRSYKGKKPNWISSHSSVFLNFLKYQIDKALLATDLEVLMIDAQTSSALATRDQWNGGDFSLACRTNFTTWLQNNYTSQELNTLGITNISTFDYRSFLNSQGIVTDSDYRNRVQQHLSNGTQLPLLEEFRLFQNQSIKSLTEQLIVYAKQQAQPRDIVIGTSSPLNDPFRSTITDSIDFYQQELAMHAGDYQHPTTLTYKVAETLNKPFILTAEPDDWEEIKTNITKEPEVKKWIAEAYAQGAIFIAPAEQWTVNSGNYIPTIDFTYIYNWISNNNTLFDNYTKVDAEVALVISREATRKYVYRINSLIEALEQENIPFNILIAEDDFYNSPLNFQQLNSYKKVLVQEDEYNWYLSNNLDLKNNLDLLQTKLEIVPTHDINGQKINIDLTSLKNSLQNIIDVSSLEIKTYPRTNNTTEKLIHLVNQEIDNNNDFVEQRDFTVKLMNNNYTSATYSQPGSSPIELDIAYSGDTILLSGFDGLMFWGVISLKSEIITSLNLNKDNNVTIYPNPTQNIISLPKKSHYKILNNTGVPILEGDNSIIDISQLPEGIYYINYAGIIEKIIKH